MGIASLAAEHRRDEDELLAVIAVLAKEQPLDEKFRQSLLSVNLASNESDKKAETEKLLKLSAPSRGITDFNSDT